MNRNQRTVLRLLQDTKEIEGHIGSSSRGEYPEVKKGDIFNALLQLELKHVDKEREEYYKMVRELNLEDAQDLISEVVAEDFHNWNNTKNKGIDTLRDAQSFLEDVFDVDRRRAEEIMLEYTYKKIDLL